MSQTKAMRMIDEYNKILEMISEGAKREGLTMFGMIYLRANDSVSDPDAVAHRTMVNLSRTDELVIRDYLESVLSVEE